ncbi:MAG: plasmid maintenance system killer [Actinobacteria bacterium]|nr:MAG: plasmid maintenance system killer [Actinomycetota bacterium]
MEIYFSTKKLAGVLDSDKERVRALGVDAAKALARRLSQLSAASELETMRTLSSRCHELKGDRAGQLAVDVTKGLRLIFEPADDPPPSKPDGGLDWTAVKAIRILEVTDYHGS